MITTVRYQLARLAYNWHNYRYARKLRRNGVTRYYIPPYTWTRYRNEQIAKAYTKRLKELS